MGSQLIFSITSQRINRNAILKYTILIAAVFLISSCGNRSTRHNEASSADVNFKLSAEDIYKQSIDKVTRSFIVDIKDTNAGIYYKYTGGSLLKVMSNLDLLKSKILADASISVIVRIPRIPVFNTPDDVESSIKVIRERYSSLFSIDTFEYVPDKSHVPAPDGKKICSILKDLRGSLITENGLSIKQKKCNHKGNCPGTCPMCDAELDYINGQPIQSYRQTIMKMDKYVQDLRIKPTLSSI